MKRILLDLDVVVVSLFANEKDDRKEIAKEFIKNVENKEFFIITPTIMLEIVS